MSQDQRIDPHHHDPQARGRDTQRVAVTIPAVILGAAQAAAKEKGLSLSAYITMLLASTRGA
ncbi:MAG: hypothetical protein H6735_00180 [Alphaproteobacteria bacterium]|nr:hypothetical protein [Alphaproteobacteria bacterium]